MADDNITANADSAQDGADGQSQEDTTDAQAGAGDDTRDDTLDPEAARKLRSEAKNLRDRAKKAEAELEQLKNAGLSDAEKRDRELTSKSERITALEADIRMLRVQVTAGKLGIVDPEAAAKLLNWDGIDGDDPKQLERALRDLVKEKPYLSKLGDGADGGAGRNGARAEGDMNSILRQAAGASASS